MNVFEEYSGIKIASCRTCGTEMWIKRGSGIDKCDSCRRKEDA